MYTTLVLLPVLEVGVAISVSVCNDCVSVVFSDPAFIDYRCIYRLRPIGP